MRVVSVRGDNCYILVSCKLSLKTEAVAYVPGAKICNFPM